MPTTIFDRFQVVDAFPALYVDTLDAVVVADLHLGLESLMAKEGTYMPKVQLDAIKDDMEAIIEQTDADTLIVCGDIKHEFSETTYGEREEVQDFIEFCSDLVDDILLVQGNHDNYLIYSVEDYDNVQLDDYFLLEDILFLHGHELQEDLATLDADYIVMGHEHPALALQDNVGVTEKIDCFLYGEMEDGRNLVVLPAFSRLAEGTPVNRADTSHPDILSPILRNKIDMQSMKAIGVDKEAGIFEFPEVGRI